MSERAPSPKKSDWLKHYERIEIKRNCLRIISGTTGVGMILSYSANRPDWGLMFSTISISTGVVSIGFDNQLTQIKRELWK